jgi:hypothetical protein
MKSRSIFRSGPGISGAVPKHHGRHLCGRIPVDWHAAERGHQRRDDAQCQTQGTKEAFIACSKVREIVRDFCPRKDSF